MKLIKKCKLLIKDVNDNMELQEYSKNMLLLQHRCFII